MEAPSSLQCETFVLSPELVPSTADLLQAADPDQMESLYRQAGLQVLADNVEPLRRAATAAQNYAELREEEYRLYADHLSQTVGLDKCVIPPPETALSVLINAQKSNLFSKIVAMTNPTTGETLLIGQIKMGDTKRYFKIAQWGYGRLTSIVQLRKQQQQQQRFSHTIGRRVNDALSWRPPTRVKKSSRRSSHSPVYFGAVTLLVSAPCWLFLPSISWWLFAGVLGVAMILCGYYVAKKTSYNSYQRWTVGWIIAAQMVAAIVMGGTHVYSWFNANRTEQVLVCGTHEANGEWIIETNVSTRNLEAGFYNGTYYRTGVEDPAKMLVGNWVNVTEHGHSVGNPDDGPFVTAAQTLRPGRCGNGS